MGKGWEKKSMRFDGNSRDSAIGTQLYPDSASKSFIIISLSSVHLHSPSFTHLFYPFSLLSSKFFGAFSQPHPQRHQGRNSRTPSAVGCRCSAAASRWWRRAGSDPDRRGAPGRSTARRWRWAPGFPSPDSPSCPRKAWEKQVLPSGYVKIAIENGHRNSGFTNWKWWFSIAMLNYQSVYGPYIWHEHDRNDE